MTFRTPSEFFASFYMFMIIMGPKGVCIWIVVTSEEVRSICDQLLVSILWLISIIEWVLLGVV